MNKIACLSTLLGKVYVAECPRDHSPDWAYTWDIAQAKALSPEECEQFKQRGSEQRLLVSWLHPKTLETIQG